MLSFRRFDLPDEASTPGGSADWVVFVHGAGGSSSIWHRQLRAFRARYNVLLVDLRGHGDSQRDEAVARLQRYSFEEIAREVVEVLDAEGIARAHFVGVSLGSIVIRAIGEVAPERVASMAFAGAIVRLDLRSRVLVGLGNVFKRVVPFGWLYRLFAWIIMPRRRHRESRLLFVNEARRIARREFLRWYRLTAEVNPLLHFYRETELAVPTLYVMGAEDHLFLPPVRLVAAAHRSAELVVVPDSGHVVNVDQADVFNRLVMAFIERVRGGSAASRPSGR